MRYEDFAAVMEAAITVEKVGQAMAVKQTAMAINTEFDQAANATRESYDQMRLKTEQVVRPKDEKSADQLIAVLSAAEKRDLQLVESRRQEFLRKLCEGVKEILDE